ncbi:hypothetical protein A7A76_07690 [Lysobacter enzymogenes]|nr:hypothetical protein [Lysobacter enzymogenes]
MKQCYQSCYRPDVSDDLELVLNPIQQAVDAQGGASALVRAIKQIAPHVSISAALVSQWRTGLRPIAPAHCPYIEAVSGVACELLRPDLEWVRDPETGLATHYRVPVGACPPSVIDQDDPVPDAA